MKQLKFFSTMGVAAMLFFSSCNSGDDTKTTQSSADTTMTKKDSPVMAAMQPQNVMRIMHKVANYAKWKMVYDGHDSDRMANGLHNYVIARGTEDSNMVMVALITDNIDKAKQWASSPELKERMKKGGVMEPVTIDYGTSVMSDTTAIQQTVRVMIKHKVKDWDAWKKVFDGDKQARMDAGLTDRVIGHTAGDNNDVYVVFAVADEAKAKAFMNSQALKDKMKDGGVEGAPSFFWYRIVQKY